MIPQTTCNTSQKKVISNQKDWDTRNVMSQTKFYEGYSRWDNEKERYETWDESVIRVMNMHRDFYADKMTPELSPTKITGIE